MGKLSSWALLYHVKVSVPSYDLPDDVFEPGEVRPTRPKKKVIKKVDSASKKRSFDASEIEVRLQSTLPLLTSCLILDDQPWHALSLGRNFRSWPRSMLISIF